MRRAFRAGAPLFFPIPGIARFRMRAAEMGKIFPVVSERRRALCCIYLRMSPDPWPPPTPPGEAQTLFGRAILAIEDHPDSREMLATALRLVGAQVFVVSNLKDAQRQLDMYLPSLIVCDLRLPDGTGVDFIRWLRARDKERGGAVPCIAVTGYPIEFPIQGFDGYMRKPIDLAKLCNMATDLLRLR